MFITSSENSQMFWYEVMWMIITWPRIQWWKKNHKIYISFAYGGPFLYFFNGRWIFHLSFFFLQCNPSLSTGLACHVWLLLICRLLVMCSCIKTPKKQNNVTRSRCAGESIIETIAGGRQWWGWDGDREPRRYFRDSTLFFESKPLLSFLVIYFVTPSSSVGPHRHSGWKLNGLFLSQGVFPVSFLRMVIVFPAPLQWMAPSVAFHCSTKLPLKNLVQ